MGHSHHIEIYKKLEKKSCSNRYCIPVKYLVPIAGKYPELKEQFGLARTDSEQIKKRPQRGLNFTMVLEVGLEPTKPEGERFTVSCHCH